MSLDRLPHDILQQITAIVHDEHPRSLASLMCVSTALHAASTPQRLRQVVFTVSGEGREFGEQVDRFINASQRSHGIQFVRWLEVRGLDDSRVTNGSSQGSREDEPWSLERHIQYQDTKDPWNWSQTSRVNYYRQPDSSKEDAKWKPLVKVLEQMTGLRDFVFNVEDRLPRRILETLQSFHPDIRLHIPLFKFLSLQSEVTDELEMAIASSPLLHTLGVLYNERDSGGVDDYGREAALCLLQGVARNLKRLALHYDPPGSSICLYEARDRPRKAWQGFSPGPWDEAIGQGYKAELESLSPEHFELSEWRSLFNFDALTHLDIGHPLSGNDLKWMARHPPFPNLKRLALEIECDDYDECSKDAETAMFFESLNPLVELRLSGYLGEMLPGMIINRHGPTLRCLRLEYNHNEDAPPARLAYDIGERCLILERLETTIGRRMGDPIEIEQYRQLAGLQELTALELTLKCAFSDTRVEVLTRAHPAIKRRYEDDWMQEPFDSQVSNGQLYESLINGAVDERLARSMWHLITETERGTSSLKRLKLHIDCTPLFDISYLRPFSRVTYTLEREQLNKEAVVRFIDPDKGKRDAEFERQRRSDEIAGRACRVTHEQQLSEGYGNRDGAIMHVFRQLWPETKEGSRGWIDDWESFPLQEGNPE